MCGIVGIVDRTGQNINKDILDHMNNMMIRRGPDGSGLHADKNVGIGMRRLSIIDIENGTQPLSTHDGQVHLVLNGEIYNYIELRSELERKNYIFKTGSDAEALLHLYCERGLDAIHELNGMFAFALWDNRKKKLWIGRDRLGIKPLYYYFKNDYLIFGSSLDVFKPVLDLKIDRESVLLYLGLSYIPYPRSIYKDIKKLEPGSYIVYQDDHLSIQKYWDPFNHNALDLRFEDLQEEISHLIHDSMKIHMRSDVPVGCFLSGGIDSSTITALFSEYYDKDIHTYSVDFNGKSENDLKYAEIVAKQFKTIHHPFTIKSEEALSNLKEIVPLLDEPLSDSALIPSYILSKKAKDIGIKVLLSGAGGDEVFGGYSRHYKYRTDYAAGSAPNFLRKILDSSIINSDSRYINHAWKLIDRGMTFGLSTSGIALGHLKLLMRHESDFKNMVDLLIHEFKALERWQKEVGFSLSRMYMDLTHYLPDNVLALTDKASMAASLEARVPLLDHRIVELVFASNYRCYLTKTCPKIGLYNIAENLLDPRIVNRPKTGFNGPVYSWIRDTAWKNAIETELRAPSFLMDEIFDPEKMSKTLYDRERSYMMCESIYQALTFQLWEKESSV